MGLQVSVANDGWQVVQMVRHNNYDAVLMDIQMPGMDGYQATAQIRKIVPDSAQGKSAPRSIDGKGHRFRADQLPIIAMTANALDGDNQKALDAGMNDYVSKPVDVMQLVKVLQRWLPQSKPLGLPEATTEAGDQNPGSAAGAMDVLDTASALTRLGNNRDLYLRLLAMFRAEHAQEVQHIRAALKINDTDLAKRLAHTMKGLAGTIGADELGAASKQLETAIADRIEPLYDEFVLNMEQKLVDVLAAVANLVDK
jgi:CheY-like chemotaxis protein/HPt (histidine-containing phosphotransfer) domain-containing protein